MTDHLTPLQIAQECYINLFKSEYGVKPRIMDSELWNDIEWLERQIDTMCSEILGADDDKELGFFDELLVNLQPEDYD